MTQPLPPGLTHESMGTQDYGKHAQKPEGITLDKVAEKVQLAYEMDLEISRMKKAMADKQRKYDDLVMNEIPEMMAEVGMMSLKTSTGLKVEVDTKLFASIPTATSINKEKDKDKKDSMIERRRLGLAWLSENGHGNLVKTQFVVQFPAGDEKDAKKFRSNLSRYKKIPHNTEGVEVNASTLSRVVRQLHEQGDQFPTGALGVYEKRAAKITT